EPLLADGARRRRPGQLAGHLGLRRRAVAAAGPGAHPLPGGGRDLLGAPQRTGGARPQAGAGDIPRRRRDRGPGHPGRRGRRPEI
ncbi:MAG: hypothetical protein AVDCRST_MAG06-2211, partial [uncultured Nocardioides sp.]